MLSRVHHVMSGIRTHNFSRNSITIGSRPRRLVPMYLNISLINNTHSYCMYTWVILRRKTFSICPQQSVKRDGLSCSEKDDMISSWKHADCLCLIIMASSWTLMDCFCENGIVSSWTQSWENISRRVIFAHFRETQNKPKFPQHEYTVFHFIL